MCNEEDLLDEDDDDSCFLNEEQVPGASLRGRDVAALKVPELKQWLQCQKACLHECELNSALNANLVNSHSIRIQRVHT